MVFKPCTTKIIRPLSVLSYRWPAVLLQQGYTFTSIRIMLLNVSALVKHIRTFHAEKSGLSSEQFERVLLQLKKLQKDNSRRIKAHQQTVKWKKSSEYAAACIRLSPFCASHLILAF